jgi:hypothetical protein
MNKDDLILYAINADVAVTESWTEQQIAQAIVQAGVELPEAVARELKRAQEKAAKADKPAPVRLRRDYWDDEGKRHRQGTVINVDVAAAKTLIKEEKAERADPLPGEGDQRKNG